MQLSCGCDDKKLLACLSPRSAMGWERHTGDLCRELAGVHVRAHIPARIFPATQEDCVLPGFALS